MSSLPFPLPAGPILPGFFSGETAERQVDDEPGGGFVEVGDDVNDEQEQIFGFDPWGQYQSNPLLRGETTRAVYDTIFEYDEYLNGSPDSQDLAGGNLYSTIRGTLEATDEAGRFAGDASDAVGGADNLASLVIGLVVLTVGLYLIRPFVEIVAAVVGE